MFVVESDIMPEFVSIDNSVDERAVYREFGALVSVNYLGPQISTPFPWVTLTVSVKVGVY